MDTAEKRSSLKDIIRLLKLIRKYPYSTRAELAEKLNRPANTVHRYLQTLLEERMIGSKPGTRNRKPVYVYFVGDENE